METGTFKVKGDFILNAPDTIALEVREATVEIGKVAEGEAKKLVQITGDINFDSKGADAAYKDKNGNTINAKADSKVDITISGQDSYWKGDPYLTWNGNDKITPALLEVKGFHLTLENGGTWWPKIDTHKDLDIQQEDINDPNYGREKYIAVPRVTLEGGNINVPQNVDLIVRETDGSGGNINFVEATGDEEPGTFAVEKTVLISTCRSLAKTAE